MSVLVTREGPVCIVTLNRPEARNAVDPPTARALYSAMLDFEADDRAQVAILTGAGAGSDWISSLSIPEDWTDPMDDPIPGPMGPSRLMLRKPVIAAIEGPAVAGGMELALWCDLRVMAKPAVMGVYCRRWGVPLIDGGTVRLPRLVGQGRANDLILTGRPVTSGEAAQIGLADRVCARGQALEEALDLAQSLTAFPQACLRADHLSARMSPEHLAEGLRREWASATVLEAEGIAGATRFAEGRGRGGDFSDI
ncbi:crotonase/enoyl-CoA hydratase family protein [Thalassococcus sp. S3]|uniref:crotonase/enoyl-CoA hydratase family protein n=1 Tax=Thalassococcus sp. S3 TaxID=2017482 RepID=UPI0010247600|nr:crotonase/enoyl-CoA hydratase family protein [Thalassococcus sp. S3]QBF33062.1 enoyl-CoA hydratase [Thalassococcus sp. S3]